MIRTAKVKNVEEFCCSFFTSHSSPSNGRRADGEKSGGSSQPPPPRAAGPQQKFTSPLTMSAAEEEVDNGPSSKRVRHDDRNDSNEVTLYAPPLEDDIYLQQHDKIRTSSLAEPTMKLSGHKGSVYCLAYDPQGEVLCSGSFDSTCLLWKGEF